MKMVVDHIAKPLMSLGLVPQPMGGNVLVNPHFDPNYYDSAAAKTSTPLKVCSKGSTASDAWSLTPQFAGRREGSIEWIPLQDVAGHKFKASQILCFPQSAFVG